MNERSDRLSKLTLADPSAPKKGGTALAEGSVLVLGDLTVDVLVGASDDIPSHRVEGHDLTLIGDTCLRVGGSALLMAKAMAGRCTPAVVAAVGDDTLADSVQAALAQAGIDDRGVQRSLEAATSVVNVVHFPDGTRLMVRPLSHAGRYIDSNVATEVARGLGSACRLLFISGYSLLGQHTGTQKTVFALAEWARANNVPICVDLVPHEFAESVGPLTKVSDLVGSVPDIVVAELRTVRGFNLVPAADLSDDCSRMLTDAATALKSHSRSIAVVQHQVRPGIYGQATIVGCASPEYEEHSFAPETRLGLGDRLLTQALSRAGYV